jgi:tape measure domain-containing protein
VATETEIIDVLVRLRGGAAAAREADSFAGKIGAIGRTAAGITVALGALGAAGAGISFNSTMEQNQIAFEQFLGSAEAANAEVQSLLDLSNQMPQFGFDTFAGGAKRLLAMGDPIERVNTDLATLADTASGLGLGSEGIDRMVLALGQMRSTGVVQGDELRQLQEAGIKVYDYMIKAGIITRKDIGQIGNMHIDAAKAIDAIMTGMQADFGGLSARATHTWQYQLGQVKNYGAQAAGALVRPIMDLAESTVLPYIAGQLKQAATYLRAGGAAGLLETLGHILRMMTPVIAAFVAYRAALLGVAAAEGLVAAGAATMGLVMTLATVLTLIPAVTSLADAMFLMSEAIGALGLSVAAVSTLGIALLIAGLVYAYMKVDWFRAGVDAMWNAIASGATMALDSVKTWANLAWEAIRGLINLVLSAWNALHFTIPHFHAFGHDFGGQTIGVPPVPLLANGGQVPIGGAAVVGDAGPELLTNQGGTAVVSPMGNQRGGMAHFVLMLPDMRILAEGVAEEGRTAVARGS